MHLTIKLHRRRPLRALARGLEALLFNPDVYAEIMRLDPALRGTPGWDILVGVIASTNGMISRLEASGDAYDPGLCRVADKVRDSVAAADLSHPDLQRDLEDFRLDRTPEECRAYARGWLDCYRRGSDQARAHRADLGPPRGGDSQVDATEPLERLPDGSLKITGLRMNSPFYRLGCQAGDVVLAVNGVVTSRLPDGVIPQPITRVAVSRRGELIGLPDTEYSEHPDADVRDARNNEMLDLGLVALSRDPGGFVQNNRHAGPPPDVRPEATPPAY